MIRFEGSLKRGPRVCSECDSCHEVRIKKLIDGDYREVVYYQCWGVSEPFYINNRDLDKPCTEYKDAINYKEFKSIEEFYNLLTEKEKEEFKDFI